MSNNYVPDVDPLDTGSLARSGDINDRYENVVSGFDRLPNPANGQRGFGEPVVAADPTELEHLVTRNYMENVWLTPQMKTDLTNLAGVQSNIELVAQNNANIQLVVDDMAEVEAVAGSIVNVDAVGTDIANVNTVAGDIANVNTVAANIADVNALAPSADDLNTISTNLTGLLAAVGSEVNAAASETAAAASATAAATSEGLASQWAEFSHYNFQMAAYAEQYAHDAAGIAAQAATEISNTYVGTFAADPAAAAQGVLYFNSTDNEMKVSTGTAWVTAYTGDVAARLTAIEDEGGALRLTGDPSLALAAEEDLGTVPINKKWVALDISGTFSTPPPEVGQVALYHSQWPSYQWDWNLGGEHGWVDGGSPAGCTAFLGQNQTTYPFVKADIDAAPDGYLELVSTVTATLSIAGNPLTLKPGTTVRYLSKTKVSTLLEDAGQTPQEAYWVVFDNIPDFDTDYAGVNFTGSVDSPGITYTRPAVEVSELPFHQLQLGDGLSFETEPVANDADKTVLTIRNDIRAVEDTSQELVAETEIGTRSVYNLVYPYQKLRSNKNAKWGSRIDLGFLYLYQENSALESDQWIFNTESGFEIGGVEATGLQAMLNLSGDTPVTDDHFDYVNEEGTRKTLTTKVQMEFSVGSNADEQIVIPVGARVNILYPAYTAVEHSGYPWLSGNFAVTFWYETINEDAYFDKYFDAVDVRTPGIRFVHPAVVGDSLPISKIKAGTGVDLTYARSDDNRYEMLINSSGGSVEATLQIEHTVDDDEPTLNLWDSGGSNPSIGWGNREDWYALDWSNESDPYNGGKGYRLYRDWQNRLRLVNTEGGWDCFTHEYLGGWTFGSSGEFKGDLLATGNVTAYSDERLKENIEPIEGALDKVEAIGGYTFDRVDIEDRRMTGVLAQEVMEVLPEAVIDPWSEDGYYSVDYGSMAGLLIEAIKELKAEVDELKARLD